jgi:hypothetical protein
MKAAQISTAFRHNWVDGTERRIPACDSSDGNDRTEKTCAACSLVKVTIHYPNSSFPGREWITASGEKWVGDATPPCIPKNVAMQVPIS